MMRKLSCLLVAVLVGVAFISCKPNADEENVTNFEGTFLNSYESGYKFTKSGDCYLVSAGIPDYSLSASYTYEEGKEITYSVTTYYDAKGNLLGAYIEGLPESYTNKKMDEGTYTNKIKVERVIENGIIKFTDTGVTFSYKHQYDMQGDKIYQDNYPSLDDYYKQSDYVLATDDDE